jgi:hypothetical protein
LVLGVFKRRKNVYWDAVREVLAVHFELWVLMVPALPWQK